MKRALLVTLALVASACNESGHSFHDVIDGGDADGMAADSVQSDDAIGGDAASAHCGFDVAAASWTLPPAAEQRGYGAFEGVNADGNFVTVDLDGDRRPDLVRTFRFDDATVGVERWIRHAGSFGGFAAAGVDWALPMDAGPFRYARATNQIPSYDLLDLDGDARPELIVTYGGSAAVGTNRWDVYHNEGDGFAATSTAWALPSGYPAFAFRDVRGPAARCPDAPSFEVFDIDGDDRPDLVVTDSCGGGVPTSWLVYRNNGAGFDGTPAVWSLRFPAYAEDCEWPRLVRFAHIDLDADRRPELVITASCTSSDVGGSHWIVHRNLGDQFSTQGQLWALPGGQDFDRLDRRDRPSFMTSDVDGDRRPDLVVVSRVGTDLGTNRWLVHRNNGAGFSAGEDWCLPSGYGADAFAVTPHEWCATFQDTPAWALIDLDADGSRELVVANDGCDQTSIAGTDRWLVHRQ